MAITYTNRQGKVYHLQAKSRANGNVGYSFSRKPTGQTVGRLPDGYEIYELPDNGQVFLRKIKPSLILPSEKESVEAAIRKYAPKALCKVDVDEDSIVIWLADNDFGAIAEYRSRDAFLSELSRQAFLERMRQNARYMKVMRFCLADDERNFGVDRWCFRGRVDDWISLSFGRLEQLLKKYVPHLGKESFYELM